MSFMIGKDYGPGFFDDVVKILSRFNPAPDARILYLRDFYKFNMILVGLNGLILILLIYIAYRVVKLTKCENKTIIIMVIMMNLTMLFELLRVLYLSMSAENEFTDYNYYK